MKKGQSMETITLEEALELFKLPRTLGEYEGKTVSVGVGRFGPYIQHNKVYVSLPKTLDPMKVTLEEAEQLILEKRAKEAERHIKKFDEEPELEILNGRYGPYIAYKGNNYKIPKDIVPQDLSLKSCLELVKYKMRKVLALLPKVNEPQKEIIFAFNETSKSGNLYQLVTGLLLYLPCYIFLFKRFISKLFVLIY